MIRAKYGQCVGSQTAKGCDSWGYLVNQTHKLCKNCNNKRLNKSVIVRKTTGELQLFKEIWNERPHYSQVSGKRLNGFNVGYFSHILTKAAYPSYRLDKQNIVLKTLEEHHLWETQRHKLTELPEWKWVFELEETLIRKYYQK